MPFYENVFVVRQDVAGSQVETLVETYENLVKQNGGTVAKKEFWGLKGLAYRIRKNRKAHFVLLNLDCPPAAVNELERNMRINEDVLRYLTVRVEVLEEGPSAVLTNKDRPAERTGFFGGGGGRGGREGGFGGGRGAGGGGGDRDGGRFGSGRRPRFGSEGGETPSNAGEQ